MGNRLGSLEPLSSLTGPTGIYQELAATCGTNDGVCPRTSGVCPRREVLYPGSRYHTQIAPFVPVLESKGEEQASAGSDSHGAHQR